MSWFQHSTSRIYYEESGRGDPILLLPGFAGRIEELAALKDSLVAANYKVISADLPGSGRSEPQPRQYPESYFEDDAQAFAALLQTLAVGPTHLLGFSDGGEVSILMAALAPGAVRSVVAWGAAGVLNDPDGRLRGAMFNVVDNPIPPLKEFRDYLVAAYGEANARAMTQSAVGAIGQIIERGGDISLSKADLIRCPVLLISGEHDFFAPPALACQLATRIRLAETIAVDGAGHDVHHARPDWLAQTVVEWLQKH